MSEIEDRIKRKSNKDMLEYVYYDKEIMPFCEAGISIASNSLHYGSLVFGGIRGYNRNNQISVFRLKEHHERLMNACRIMAFPFTITYEEFYNIIAELIKKNEPKGNFYIRPFIFCDEARIGPKLHNLEFDLAVYMQNMDDYADHSRGIRFLTSSFRKYSDSAISTKAKVGGSYVNSMLATHQAHIAGMDEALLFNDAGNLAEASVANALIVLRGQVITPPLASGPLEGITIRSVIELLEYNNIPVLKENIDRSTLYIADELIITGTAMQIGYGSEVDGRFMTNHESAGPITQLLATEMQKVLNNEHELSVKWLEVFK